MSPSAVLASELVSSTGTIARLGRAPGIEREKYGGTLNAGGVLNVAGANPGDELGSGGLSSSVGANSKNGRGLGIGSRKEDSEPYPVCISTVGGTSSGKKLGVGSGVGMEKITSSKVL